MAENKSQFPEEKLENPLIKYKNLIIIFILFVVATVTILLNSEIFVISYQKIKAIPAIYVIIIIVMVLFLWLSDAFLLHYPLNNPKLTFWDSLQVNLAGAFFSAVTPYSAGSQPSRLYYLHKKGVSVDKSIGGVLFKAFSYQCVIIILGLLSLIGGRNVILKMDNYRIVLTLGFLYNITLFVVSFLIAYSKKITNWLIQVVNSIGSKQNKDKILSVDKQEINKAIKNFYLNMRSYITNKKMIAVMFITYTIRQLVYNIIPIVILYALGFTIQPSIFIELICLSALMNIIITIVPTPGGVVAAEGAFILLFGLVFMNAENDLYAVMLMWRFFTHYLLIIFGFFAVLYLTIYNSKMDKKRGMLNGSNNS